MGYKSSYKIETYIDPDIKVGCIVRLFDGSALTLKDNGHQDQDYYIVDSYPEITGLDKKLKDIDAKVVETGISEYVIARTRTPIAYVQDIVIQIGDAEFRTCSKSVRNMRQKKLERIING